MEHSETIHRSRQLHHLTQGIYTVVSPSELSNKSSSITSNSSVVQASHTPAIPPSKHAVLSGTSIAAVTLPNNDRHVFFQERSGIIRQAIYTASASVWESKITTKFQVVADDVRSATPLAAAYYTDPDYRDVSGSLLG